MNEIDLRSIDLNLLVALDALLSERSVTRAAERLERTQSATSHALSRLRELFDDPLLQRSGRDMLPTPRALLLQAPLERALRDLEDLLQRTGAFDPAMSRRSFVLSAPEALSAAFPKMLMRLRRLAPGLTIDVRAPVGGGPMQEIALGRADLVLGPTPVFGSNLSAESLGALHHAVAMRADHPLAGNLTLQGYLNTAHVAVRTASPAPSLVQRVLDGMAAQRFVAVSVPTLQLALRTAAESDLLFTAPESLLRDLAGDLGLRLETPPFEVPTLGVAAYWADRLDNDLGHKWLREQVAAYWKELLTSASE